VSHNCWLTAEGKMANIKREMHCQGPHLGKFPH